MIFFEKTNNGLKFITFMIIINLNILIIYLIIDYKFDKL